MIYNEGVEERKRLKYNYTLENASELKPYLDRLT